jgi:hypothetical protein
LPALEREEVTLAEPTNAEELVDQKIYIALEVISAPVILRLEFVIEGVGGRQDRPLENVERDVESDVETLDRIGRLDGLGRVAALSFSGAVDREVFGNFTERPVSAEPNGFLALAGFDNPQKGGNSDGKIDGSNAVFTNLRLWQDANHNGVSEPGELHMLSEFGVSTLELDYKLSKRTDRSRRPPCCSTTGLTSPTRGRSA